MPKFSRARRRPLSAAERLEGRALLAADPFSIAVLPDTQYYSQKYPAIFNSQTQWVVDNLASERIAFVTQLGDIVQSGAGGTNRNALQWQRADAAMDLLDGDRAVNPDGLVAYSATLGNHDYDTVSDKLSGASRYQEFFGPARYESRSWYTEDSGMPGNHAQVFMAGGYRVLHITLQWEPLDADLAWAQRVVAAHPGIPTIVSTHSYLNPLTKARQTTIQGRSAAGVNPGNTGEQVWQKFISVNPQIFLVMNGHFHSDTGFWQVSRNVASQPVVEMTIDYQSLTNGGDGWMRLLTFDTASGRIDVKTFSPSLGREDTSPAQKFSVPFDFAGRFGAPLPEGFRSSTFQNGRVVGDRVYAGAVDTQVRQAAPTTAYGSVPTPLLVDAADAGKTNASQTLLKFEDIVGAGAGRIPAGARILSARLVVESTDSGAGGRLHRVLTSWTGAETWNTWVGGVQADGVEAAAAASAQVGVAARTPIVPVLSDLEIDVTADVQAWVGGGANHGWAFLPWAGGTNGWMFTPSEAARLGSRPALEVDWLPPTASVTTFQQGVSGYTGTLDTMIRPAAAATRFDTAATLWVDGPVDNGTTQTLLAFGDLFGSGTGQVPADAVIESARLVVTTPAIVANSPGGGATLHRVLAAWTGASTWSKSFGGNGVQTDGQEAVAAPDARTGSVARGIASFDVTASLKAWQAGAANRGWLLNSVNSDGWGVASAQAEAVGERPRLVVTWKPAPAAPVAPAPVAAIAPVVPADPRAWAAVAAWAALASDTPASGEPATARRRSATR